MENSNAMQNIERGLDAIARAIAGERAPNGTWVEIGRTTLTAEGDSLSVTLSDPTYKFLRVEFFTRGNATGTTNSLDTTITFNSDSGNNYAHRYAVAHGAETTITSTNGIPVESGQTDANQPSFTIMEIFNIQADEKLFFLKNVSGDAAGAGTLPTCLDMQGKWANSADWLSIITMTNTGGGDFAIGSEVIVYGHN